ncbi:MAG: DNA mismatch repair endonuclease MutL [Parachlamydiales bacterium]
MSSNIQILDDILINKIAAGEVIENPISVIKELVENSLDAQAKNIIIEIRQSGFISIKIEDDGIGMSKEDAVLCFQRHATSKIKNFEDLLNISSMGFRGEALSSIAAVSKVDLKTSKDDLATHVKVEASKIILVDEIARNNGTSIEVKSLFFNVPVRKKFQKSLSYINSEIIKTSTQLAIANPNIGFKLILNEKIIFSCQNNELKKNEAFKKRVKELFQDDFVSSCIELDFQSENISIYGYIGLPQYSKKTKSLQHLIINDRVVSNYLISKFIKDAYANRIAEDDYPIFALNIKLPNNLIDVNVHPQKKEIRISDSFYLKDFIKKAIDYAFENKFKENKNEEFKACFSNDLNFKKADFNPHAYEEETSFLKDKENVFQKYEKQMYFEKIYNESPIENFLLIDRFVLIDSNCLHDLEGSGVNELLVIDLGVLNAGLLFEKIKNKKGFSKIQNLLVPINIELSKSDMAFVEENIDSFINLGIDLKVITQKSISIEAIDESIINENINELFFVILEDLKFFNKSEKIDHIYEKKLSRELLMFSKKKKYSMQEAKDLLKKFKDMKNTNFDSLRDPHFIKLDKEKIERLFKC